MKYVAPNYNIETLEATDEIMASWISGIFNWSESTEKDENGVDQNKGTVEVDFDNIMGN